MKSIKNKNNSANKTNRDEHLRMAKSRSHYVLPTKKRSVSQKKQKPKDRATNRQSQKDRQKQKQKQKQKVEIKRTQSKKKVPRMATIEERISNIRKGFQELEKRIIHSQQITESITEPDIKRLMQSGNKSVRTRTFNKSQCKSQSRSASQSPSKSGTKSKGGNKSKRRKNSKCNASCVYSKAVYNLLNIINYQKTEIENLKNQIKMNSHR